MSMEMGENVPVQFTIPQTELLAATPIEVVAPVAGFIREASVIVQTAVTTGGVVTFKVGTTDVDGLSLTVADGATKGTVVGPDEPTAFDDSRKVTKGQRIQVVPSAAFDTAGALAGVLIINTAH